MCDRFELYPKCLYILKGAFLFHVNYHPTSIIMSVFPVCFVFVHFRLFFDRNIGVRPF